MLIIKIKVKKLCVDVHCVCTVWWSSKQASTQDILNIYTQLFNFNFNYQHTIRCLDCGEYIYKQLHLVRMHTSLYYSLCNSAPWWWSSMTETCRCYKLRKYISFVHFGGFHLQLHYNARCSTYKTVTSLTYWVLTPFSYYPPSTPRCPEWSSVCLCVVLSSGSSFNHLFHEYWTESLICVKSSLNVTWNIRLHATCPDHLLLGFITVAVLGEDWILQNSSQTITVGPHFSHTTSTHLFISHFPEQECLLLCTDFVISAAWFYIKY
jgi:hypothetical protein